MIPDTKILIIPPGMWLDFSEVAESKGLEYIYSEEPDGFHVFGGEELGAILWAIQVLRGLELVFGGAGEVGGDGVSVPDVVQNEGIEAGVMPDRLAIKGG
jgi:hypothetical protein